MRFWCFGRVDENREEDEDRLGWICWMGCHDAAPCDKWNRIVIPSTHRFLRVLVLDLAGASGIPIILQSDRSCSEEN